MKTSSAVVAALCQFALSLSAHSTEPDPAGVVDAPKVLIGPTIFNWMHFFGPEEYQIIDVEARKSPYDDSPVVYFRMTDGKGTTALFGVSLIDGAAEVLVEVTSTSQEFLTWIGVDTLDFDDDGNAIILDPCDAEDYEEYCNSLQATFRDGKYAAVWDFYVD